MSLANRSEVLRNCRTLYTQRLKELLRDCSRLPLDAIESVAVGAGEFYDEIIATARKGSFQEEAENLTSSRLTLVNDDDLELSLRLDRMAKLLFDATGGQLWKSYLRFVTLLARPDLPKDDNPIGPRSIAQGLELMFQSMGAKPLDQKLDLIDHLEEPLLQRLPPLYDELNDFLHNQGIETAQANIVNKHEPPPVARPVDTNNLINTLASLHQALLSRLPAGGGAFAGGFPQGLTGGSVAGGAMNGLGAGLGAMMGAVGGGVPVTPGAGVLFSSPPREQIFARLNDFERRAQPKAAGPAVADDGEPRLESLIPGLFDVKLDLAPPPEKIVSTDLGVHPSSPEGLLIDTLAMIIDALVHDVSLPQALKSALACLRVVLTKQALHPDDQLSTEQSLSRRLINLFGLASLGLPPEQIAGNQSAEQVLSIANQLRVDYEHVPDALGQAARKLEQLIEERRVAIFSHAQAYQPILAQLERNDQAFFIAREAVQAALPADAPSEIRPFFEDTWREVLQKTCLLSGQDSDQWQSNLALINDLVWTFRPKDEMEERKLLAGRLPDVLKRLKAGMEYVQLNGDEQSRILDICFSLQTRAMRPRASAVAGKEAAKPSESGQKPAPPNREVRLGNLRGGGKTLLSLDFRLPNDAPARQINCRPGEWVQLTLAKRRCRLCLTALPNDMRRALLSNPDDEPPLVIHKDLLDNLLRSGEARILSRETLFDYAASKALSGIQPA